MTVPILSCVLSIDRPRRKQSNQKPPPACAVLQRLRYGEYQDLRKLVCRTLRRTDRILVIGCGNSNFSAELYDDGFEEVRR